MQLLIQRNGDGIRLYADSSIHIDAVMRQEILAGKLAVVRYAGVDGEFQQHDGDHHWKTVDTGYSPPIDITLLTDHGEAFEVAQDGPDSLILRDPSDGCEPDVRAWIVMAVDGKMQRWRVTLPDGVDAWNTEVKIERD